MMKRIVRCSIIFLLVLVLCSCGSWGIRKPDQISSDQANLVSRDFVTAISRLRGFSPRETTVQFHAPRSLFARKLHDAMRISGYGIQIVSNKEIGQNHVAYKSEQYEDTNGTTVAYQVNVGKVRLSREYEIRVGRVFPIAALSVLGATSSTDNNIDNSIFSGSEDNSGWMSIGPVQKSILTTDNGRIDPLKILDSIRIQRSAKKPKRNMANLGGSNYSDLFKQYTNKKEEILTFPFDSLTMGNTNKKIAWEMVKLFDPATDIFSVVGCSHGYSKIANGNALLATGRANRVKEELIYNNVPAEKILDESCWAGGPVKNMPARGVVLTLRKRV